MSHTLRGLITWRGRALALLIVPITVAALWTGVRAWLLFCCEAFEAGAREAKSISDAAS